MYTVKLLSLVEDGQFALKTDLGKDWMFLTLAGEYQN